MTYRLVSRAFRGSRSRFAPALTVLALTSTLVLTPPVGAQDAGPPSPDRPEEAVTVPSRDQTGFDPHVGEEQIGDDTVAQLAEDPSTAPPGTRVNVEVYGPNLQQVRTQIRSFGGEIYGSVPGFFVEARVPVEFLSSLNSADGVTRVSSVTRASTIKPKSFNSNNSALANTVATTFQMEAWHTVGHTGAGQKVGILDIFGTEELEFAIAQGRVPAPAGAFCLDSGSSCSITLRSGGPHGVAVAEIIHQMAPDAELYFATVTTLSDLAAAIDWFAAQGVTVINRSETSEFDGPGDGTGPTASLVERAVDLDMVWVAAGGNASGGDNRAGQNWLGEFNDPDGNGFHNWADGSERMGFTCSFLLGMRWDDWDSDSIATDYDIWIYDDENDRIPEAKGEDTQNEAAHRPLEHVKTKCSGATDRDYLAIRRFGDPEPDGVDTLQILGNQTLFDEWVNTSSATGPGADSKSPGAVTVGATQSANSLSLAEYSSHGPTIDGRNGVDVAAPSCLPIPVFFNFCFSGTSASAPVMTGVVAVLRGARVVESAPQIDEVLPRITSDEGIPGPDPQYGVGSLRLPPPSFLGARTVLPTCNGIPATLAGTDGDDVLVGTDGDDVIIGGRGNDRISGLDGNDLICGGFGDDILDGGAGDDIILAGPGADVARGRAGSDSIFGGHGHDELEGNAGNDEIRGFTGRDYVKGGLGDDVVFGGPGNDRIVGGKGLDELFGGNGVDRCREPIEVAVSCRN